MSGICVASAKSMAKIIPAILAPDFDTVASSLASLRSFVSEVQIDVVDGVFAPHTTWPYGDDARFEKILSEEEGLPYWEEYSFEIDLMVDRAAPAAEKWVRAGASRIIIHAESADATDALGSLQSLRGEGSFSIETGIALSLMTPLEDLERFEERYDFVQLMGIAHIGRQGEPLDERVYARAAELRRRYGGTISIDGGVSLLNARKLVQSGATRLVAGSAILKAEDPKAAYEQLLQEIS